MRGEKPPKGDAWREATVGSAARSHSYQRIWCDDCRHELIISAQKIIDNGVPPETSFWHLAQRLKCSACGSIRVGIMAASYNRDRDHPDHRKGDVCVSQPPRPEWIWPPTAEGVGLYRHPKQR
jgi:hypothetical protein